VRNKRQVVIKEILRRYGSLDRFDTVCLGVRFGVRPEVIAEDVRTVSETFERERSAQQQAALLDEQRAAELERARRILRGESG
jgi:hypothetical protein